MRYLFDTKFYENKYGSMFEGDAFEHYKQIGWHENFMPNPFIEPFTFSKLVGVEKTEPLSHLNEHWRDIKNFSPAFDPVRYLQFYKDLTQLDLSPFEHFMRYGLNERRTPGFLFLELPDKISAYPNYDWQSVASALGIDLSEITPSRIENYKALIDDDYYISRYKLDPNQIKPFEHYISEGSRYGLNPNPFFQPTWYSSHHSIEARDPLWHHVVTTARPAPFFCSKSYLRDNPNFATPTTDFVHFVKIPKTKQTSIGLTQKQINSLRKIHTTYNWDEAARHFPLLSEPAKVGERFFGEVDDPISEPPAPCTAADTYQIDFISRRMSTKKILSLDIWDTVLRRDCDPDEVKLYASAVLLKELKSQGMPHDLTAPEVFILRQLAEYTVADENYEYSYAKMINEWLDLVGISSNKRDTISRLVTDAELDYEILVTRPDPTLVDILKAVPENIRVVAVSDFYLPEDSLRRILRHHGLECYFKAVYVSCEVMKTKRQGALFDYLIKVEDVEPSDILHIGDNEHADCVMALKKKIDSYHYFNITENERKVIFKKTFDGLLTGDRYSLQQVAKRLRSEEYINTNEATLEDLALVLAGYGMFIVELARSRQIDRVFFATREGLFFKKVYDLIANLNSLKFEKYPESKILEISRVATFAASLRKISIDEMMRLWALYSIQSMNAFARSLNLCEKELESYCNLYDIDLEEEIEYPWEDSRVIALFKNPSFRTWMEEDCKLQRAALWHYLELNGFAPAENENRLIVDIGWRGSIQDNLAFLVNGTLDGAYMALYEPLTEVPSNTKKFGFLMDRTKADAEHIGEFSALEFICNGLGGSVIGYEDGKAIKKINIVEEQQLINQIIPLQESLLKRIEDLAPSIAQLPLDIGQLGEICRILTKKYIDSPTNEISEMFLQLEHNETFGLGGIEIMKPDQEVLVNNLTGGSVHSFFERKYKALRWPEAYIKSSDFSAEVETLALDQRLMLPRNKMFSKTPSLIRSLGHSVGIYAPTPIEGSGGHRTIYNLAKALDKSGFRVSLYSEYTGDAYSYLEQEMEGSDVKLHEFWHRHDQSAVIATINYSANYLSEYLVEKQKSFYFIQDFEAAFNPVSDAYILGENSYALGHHPLCIGRWLTHVLRSQYGTSASGAGLGVDTDIYRPMPGIDREDCVAVLYQPEKWRRLPDHCLKALEILKRQRPNTEIVFYGTSQVPNVSFEYTHLGLVSDLYELNKLYNKAAIGLCISLTNPSRIPYEMMAAGCVPVDVYRYNNLFDYETETGVLAYQSSESIAAAMTHLLTSKTELQRRRRNCIEKSANRSLRWETDATVNAIEHIIEGGNFDGLNHPEPSFLENPFIADIDNRAEVEAWCEWQRRLSENAVKVP